MRIFFTIILFATILLSCQNTTEQTINKDAKQLVKIEKEIVDLTTESRDQNNPDLLKKRDSLSKKLQSLSSEYQKKHKKAGNTKQFQDAYQEAKKEIFQK